MPPLPGRVIGASRCRSVLPFPPPARAGYESGASDGRTRSASVPSKGLMSGRHDTICLLRPLVTEAVFTCSLTGVYGT